jgi:hypothetical protein
MQGYYVPDHVQGKRLEIRSGDQRIVVDRKRALVATAIAGDIRARAENGMVHLLVGTKYMAMTTPVAVKVGFALAKNGGATMYHGDMVSFEVGGEEFCLPPAVAVQLGGALMLKADRADDWQRANPKRRLQ